METERLAMQPFEESDLDWLVGHRTKEDVSLYLGGSELQTPSFVKKRLDFYMDCFSRLGFSMCLTSLKETDEPIGVTGIQPLEKTGLIEVGYSFERDYWGMGLATEAARGWMEYGFNKLGLDRIVAVAEPDNLGSIRVMEKLGMTYEKSSFCHGVSVVRYSVNKEDFFGLSDPA